MELKDKFIYSDELLISNTPSVVKLSLLFGKQHIQLCTKIYRAKQVFDNSGRFSLRDLCNISWQHFD